MTRCFRFGGPSGTKLCFRIACTLDDPNALHFGTRLRAYSLKTIINRFLNARTLSWFESPPGKQKRKNTPSCDEVFPFWWAFGDSNPGPSGYEPGALTN